MWIKQRHKPPIWFDGLNPIYKSGDDWGMVYDIVNHIIAKLSWIAQRILRNSSFVLKKLFGCIVQLFGSCFDMLWLVLINGLQWNDIGLDFWKI